MLDVCDEVVQREHVVHAKNHILDHRHGVKMASVTDCSLWSENEVGCIRPHVAKWTLVAIGHTRDERLTGGSQE
jgi:hypothetical protein